MLQQWLDSCSYRNAPRQPERAASCCRPPAGDGPRALRARTGTHCIPLFPGRAPPLWPVARRPWHGWSRGPLDCKQSSRCAGYPGPGLVGLGFVGPGSAGRAGRSRGCLCLHARARARHRHLPRTWRAHVCARARHRHLPQTLERSPQLLMDGPKKLQKCLQFVCIGICRCEVPMKGAACPEGTPLKHPVLASAHPLPLALSLSPSLLPSRKEHRGTGAGRGVRGRGERETIDEREREEKERELKRERGPGGGSRWPTARPPLLRRLLAAAAAALRRRARMRTPRRSRKQRSRTVTGRPISLIPSGG